MKALKSTAIYLIFGIPGALFWWNEGRKEAQDYIDNSPPGEIMYLAENCENDHIECLDDGDVQNTKIHLEGLEGQIHDTMPFGRFMDDDRIKLTRSVDGVRQTIEYSIKYDLGHPKLEMDTIPEPMRSNDLFGSYFVDKLREKVAPL